MNNFQPPYLGAAYYPEDWPQEFEDKDITIMKEVGMNVMRIAEFAWSSMEPKEGQYDFEWLHRIVDKLGKADIAVIIGTPTCTPPIWLVEKHPEVLFMTENGERQTHGAREHRCPNHPVYRDYTRRIVTRMGQEFGKNDTVIGWQIDNEVYGFANKTCMCPVCMELFAKWMEKKYKTIDALNKAWCNALWSQTYQSFSQLPKPEEKIWHHPALTAAWREFHSVSYADFVKFQADILHKLVKQPVGTDMMPTPGLDYGTMHQSLDIVEHNHYHNMTNLWEAPFWYDMIRPLKKVPFWNTETQTTWSAGVYIRDGYKEPGWGVANSWMPIALGGEANLYWLWRQHYAGQELEHGAVITTQGRFMYPVEEVKNIARGFVAAREFINDTRPVKTGIAMHFSHRASWMMDEQPLIQKFNYMRYLLEKVYHPMIQSQLRPDVILPALEMSPYKMIVSPFLMTLEMDGLKQLLKQWIEDGGIWVAGPATDIRNIDGGKYFHAPFGVLEDWAGVTCKFSLPGLPREFKVNWGGGKISQGSYWYDALVPKPGTKALATYKEGPMAGSAAVTYRKMGKGAVVLLGTLPQPADLQALLAKLAKEAGVETSAKASPNLMVVPRKGSTYEGLMVVEHENKPATLSLKKPMVNLLDGKTYKGNIKVKPYQVMVLSLR